MFKEWYHDRPRTVFSKRLDTYGHRFLVLLAITSGKFEIDETVTEAVLNLLRYQYAAREESDPIDSETRIGAMEEKIRRTLKRGPTRERELWRGVHGWRVGRGIFHQGLDNLKRAGEIEWRADVGAYALVKVS